MRRNEAIERIRSQAGALRQFRVRALSLFGSVARDEAGPDSDVDVLVDFDGAGDFDAYMGLKFFLEDLLGVSVDLVTRTGLKPRLRDIVEREAVRVA